MTVLQSNRHDDLVYRISSELLAEIAANLSTHDLVAATHVSRLWRSRLLDCPDVWVKLDMVYWEERALTAIPHLLPRSGVLPLDLSILVPDILAPNYAIVLEAFYRALGLHAQRLRHLSFRCIDYSVAGQILILLRHKAPNLESLHLTVGDRHYGGGPSPPDGGFAEMPWISSVQWLGYSLPATLYNRSNVTHIVLSEESLSSNAALFQAFPRARDIRIDQCRNIRRLGTLPVSHPLERLELAVDVDIMTPARLSWRDLRAQRCTDVPVLVLRHYNLATLFSACREGVWQPKELSISYNEDVDAILRTGARECRMLSFRSTPSASRSVQQLMHNSACLRPISQLALALPTAVHKWLRWNMQMPNRSLPSLTTFVIWCARDSCEALFDVAGQWASRLDTELLATRGKLRAPNLTTLVLKYHPAGWNDAGYRGIVDPAKLADFIRAHIQLARGSLLPELRIDSPKVRLLGDADGLAALKAVVETIIYEL